MQGVKLEQPPVLLTLTLQKPPPALPRLLAGFTRPAAPLPSSVQRERGASSTGPCQNPAPEERSPPGCTVEGRTFSPADKETKNAKGINHRQNVK